MSGKRPLEDEGSVSDDHVTGRQPNERPLRRNEASESNGQELRQLTRRPLIPIYTNVVATTEKQEGEDDARDRSIVESRQLSSMVDESPTLVESLLRPVVRGAAKNEVERHIRKQRGSTDCQILPNTENAYELRFDCKCLNKFYTGDRIEGEGDESVRVAMVDSETKKIVKYGHLSSAWTKLSVLDGGFDKDEQGCFTRKEFDASIIRPREGKGKLLTGTIRKQLENGVGLFNIRINDISRRTTSGKFKLGASVEGTKHPTETIRPAASNSFIVRDSRLKSSEEIALTDGVDRLKNIGPRFLERLHAAGIKTVHDFLTHFYSDPKKLREILGGRMSNNKWKETVAHAQSCKAKIPVQESSQLRPEFPESRVGYSDSLPDGPSFPPPQDSLIPSLEPGLQELLIADQDESGAFLNFQSPANENCHMFNVSEVNSGELGSKLDLPSFNNHGELMPGTSQPSNVSVMGGLPQPQIFYPFQENNSNTIMEDTPQANSTATTQHILPSQSLSPMEWDDLLSTDCYPGGYEYNGHEFLTGACILSLEVGEPSHRYANDQIEQDGEADPSHFLVNAAGVKKRRRWPKFRAVLNLTLRKRIAKRNSRWLKVKASFNL